MTTRLEAYHSHNNITYRPSTGQIARPKLSFGNRSLHLELRSLDPQMTKLPIWATPLCDILSAFLYDRDTVSSQDPVKICQQLVYLDLGLEARRYPKSHSGKLTKLAISIDFRVFTISSPQLCINLSFFLELSQK